MDGYSLTVVAFLALSAAVTAAFLLATWKAGDARRESPAERARWMGGALAWVVVVVVVPLVLALGGRLRDFTAVPPASMRMVLVATVTTVLFAQSRFGLRMATGVPLWALVGFQGFRVVVELLLFALHREGVLPVQMTFAGMNFDVLAGLSAIAIAVAIRRDRVPRATVFAWSVASLLLLANIVTIAVLSMPTPWRRFHDDPPFRLVGEPPFILLPTLLVGAALFAHILVFRRLKWERATPGGHRAESPSSIGIV